MNQIERNHRRTLILLSIALAVCILASFLVGKYAVPVRELLRILASKLGFPIEKTWTDSMEAALWNIRLPRVLLSVLVGMCLAAAGASYQGVFQNPMASPDILGASAGAGFGAALAILMGGSSMMITLSAFAMSILTVGLVFTVSRHAKGDRILGLVLAGIMVSSLFQSATSFVKLVADPADQLPQIIFWLMGSLSGTAWSDLRFVIFPMLLGLLPLLALRWQLNVITMGDDDARALGVNARRVRMWTVICSTLVTASAVAATGMIGWVGLVIPHMLRRLVGSDYRYLMPASILGGGLFLLVADNVSRNIAASGIPIGILTAFIGTPFFLWLITGKGDHYEH